MQLSVSQSEVRVIEPDAFGNLELPEAERMRIKLRRPSQWRIREAISQQVVTDSGQVEVRVDNAAFLRAHIITIENPPELNIDNSRTRALRVSDLFEFDELLPIVEEISTAVAEMSEQAANPKNS